jgi:hypothetical protein
MRTTFLLGLCTLSRWRWVSTAACMHSSREMYDALRFSRGMYWYEFSALNDALISLFFSSFDCCAFTYIPHT